MKKICFLLATALCLNASTGEKIKNQTTYLESSKELEKQLNKKLIALQWNVGQEGR